MKEEFEKFMDKMSVRHIRETSEYGRLQEAFLAGAAAMRERCVDVAEEYRDAGCITSVSGNNIAAAIRKIGVE